MAGFLCPYLWWMLPIYIPMAIIMFIKNSRRKDDGGDEVPELSEDEDL